MPHHAVTHGHAVGYRYTPEYSAWQNMKRRCLNPRNPKYPYYGGRGITICERWLVFAYFWADMGSRPSPLHSLERRNNALGYSPENCYWATRTEQQQNTRWNQQLTYQGETRCHSEWARMFGIHIATLRYRLNHGWTPDEALKGRPQAPSKAKQTTPHKRYLFQGQLLSVAMIARLTNMKERTLHHRLKNSANADEAVFAYHDKRQDRFTHH